MRYDRTIIAYHGCDLETAEQLLQGRAFQPSNNDYDWLGHGIYFWEYGADRAHRFSLEKRRRGQIETPAVVGALVQLGRCFDLLDTRFTHDLHDFYPSWETMLGSTRVDRPRNLGESPDRKGRYLDCSVINDYLSFIEDEGAGYDTVRGSFQEGEPLYEGAGFYMESHIQIAVRNPSSIVGVFRPTGLFTQEAFDG